MPPEKAVRVVLDTNVVISRLLSSGGPPARLFNLWRRHVFDVAVSEAILSEYARVLRYPRLQRQHGLTSDEIDEFIADFRAFAVSVTPSESIKAVLADPDDDIFLGCAVAAGADYIVSGDAHLLALAVFRGIRILSPAVALVAFAAE